MTEVDLRVPTADALLAGVKEGVENIVRDALAEAERMREEADETLERYDDLVNELARLRAERHALKHDLEGIPDRLAKANLDSLVYGVGEDPDSLQARYIQARERLPVAEQRLGRLEDELSAITSGGSRPSKVDPSGGPRRLVKHASRESIVDNLNEAVTALERLRVELPDVVKEATAPLIKERDGLRNGQNDLWGLAKRR